ncbi:IclR family transcriptional regulator [Halalkalibacterium ligniniphilum]|uniref:IclR family transcriptional regulator n=1 Tax=Halalkalibacterium ligniniphilum TaxID=1134413 RepID=UPI000345F263|nr:IclR family transcriptional regulator [Halalkalibacterium ligniniphilum]
MSKTLAKALYLLTLFDGEENDITLDELSKRANIPKATTYRLLKTMEEHGFVKKVTLTSKSATTSSEAFQLGLRCLRLGEIAARQIDIRNIALPYMKKLCHELSESIQLVIPEGQEAVYIEKVESNRPVRLYTSVGRRAPLYAGACPRILLSFMSDEEIREILSRPLMKVTDQTSIDKGEIWETIREARQNGYTYSLSELADNTEAIGTPIFNQSGKIVGALSVGSFAGRLSSRSTVDMGIVREMWKACSEISKELGFIKPYPFK